MLSGPTSPVGQQLLSYEYRDARRERLVQGEHDAIAVSRRWIETIFVESFWPGDAFHPFLHRCDSSSCDAIAAAYRKPRGAGHIEMSVFQTLHIIVVTAAPQAVTAAPSDAPALVLELARLIFNHSGRLNLTVISQDGTGAVGCQMSEGVQYDDSDWLDTIQWWSDGSMAGFQIQKRTGPEQRIVVSPALDANRTWFALYEHPRTLQPERS